MARIKTGHLALAAVGLAGAVAIGAGLMMRAKAKPEEEQPALPESLVVITVLDSITNSPVDNAEVTLSPSYDGLAPAVATSNPGEYVFGKVRPDTYLVTARALNYTASSLRLTVNSGQTVSSTIRLTPSSAQTFKVTVQVVDTNGLVLAFANVIIAEGGFPLTSGSTGTNGEVSFDIPNNGYVILAQKSGFVNATRELNVLNQPVSVKIIMTSSLTQKGDISVGVTDALTTAPILNASVTSGGLTARLDGVTGIYLFNDVPVGTYQILVSAPGYKQNVGTAVVKADMVASIRIPLTKTELAGFAIEILAPNARTLNGGLPPFFPHVTIIISALYRNVTASPITALLAIQPIGPPGFRPLLFSQVTINPREGFIFSPNFKIDGLESTALVGRWTIEFNAFTDFPARGGKVIANAVTLEFDVIA